MAITVKTFFIDFSIKKTHNNQQVTNTSREIASLHFATLRSSGKTCKRNILCLHTLSTLCPIDFEPRLTFRDPTPRSPVSGRSPPYLTAHECPLTYPPAAQLPPQRALFGKRTLTTSKSTTQFLN